MSELYLVAHLVRGQPAFDIAEQIQIGDEVGWIIPTSGHRAYPYWTLRLDLAVDWPLVGILHTEVPEPPPDHPDHYTTHASPGTGLIRDLAARLGFVQKPTIIRRR